MEPPATSFEGTKSEGVCLAACVSVVRGCQQGIWSTFYSRGLKVGGRGCRHSCVVKTGGEGLRFVVDQVRIAWGFSLFMPYGIHRLDGGEVDEWGP